MRHRVASKQFNRDTNHRKMMIRNLVRSLIEHGEIVTTLPKAKETRRWADKLINKALTDTVTVRRQLHTFFGKRDVVNTLVEKIAPSMKKRTSGFTTILKLGSRRGDNVPMVKLTLIEQREVRHTLKSETVKAAKTKKTAVKKATKKIVVKKAVAKKPTGKVAPVVESRPTKMTQLAQRVQRRLSREG